MSVHHSTEDSALPPYLHTPLQKEYVAYLQHWQTFVEQQKKQIDARSLRETPRISIITPIYHPDPLFLSETLQSVFAQIYPHWELVIVLDGPQSETVECIINTAIHPDIRIKIIRLNEHSGISEATNAGVRASHGEYIGFLDHDDLLEPTALGMIAARIACAQYAPDLLYTDHDKIDAEGQRYDPEFKPDWSPETLLSYCYIGHFKVIRRDTFLELGGFRKEYDGAQDYDFVLRLAERTENILHIPHILYHWRSSSGSTASSASTKSDSIEQGLRALQETLTRRKKRALAIRPPFSHQFNIGVYGLQFHKKDFLDHVTIVIPTKDRPDLLEPCVHSIRTQTTYPRYEILVVNNGRVNRRLERFLEQKDVRRLDIPTEEFNFSSLLNRAIEHVQTPFVLFLNDDTEVLSSDWLLQMLGIITIGDHIGAVGAKLLYPHGQTQHSGLFLGLHDCTAGHANRGLPADDSGYHNSNRALRNYAAVTAACMLTRTHLFREVGGFDERSFPIAYNDVDYCLKTLAKGFRIVQAPDALLRHHQAASRGKTFHPDAEYASRAELRRRWFPLLRSDPYYNPNLSRHNEHFHIRSHPPGQRILFASHNLEYEGASLSLLELTTALKTRGYHVEVTSPHPGPLADAYTAQNIPLHIGTEGSPHPLLALNRDAFDILFLNTITTYNLLKNEDIAAHPTIWCIRESERDDYFQELPGLSLDLFFIASRIVFVANATRSIYGDLDRGHFTTIHNGIDLRAIDHTATLHPREVLRRDMGFSDRDSVITTVGTICPRKGQHLLVDVALELLPTFPRLTFFLVGGGTGTPYEERLEKSIRRAGLDDRIRIIPTTADVHRTYAASDLFVCLSTVESFPRVILEAMAWRLPIVATNVFGIPEQVRDTEEALLVPPSDPAVLAFTIRRLLDDPILSRTLARNARRRVEEHFGIDHMVDQYEELFGTLSPS